MTKKAYVGVGDHARNVKKIYIGVNGVSRKVKKAYIGVNGAAHLWWSGGNMKYFALRHDFLKGTSDFAEIYTSDNLVNWRKVANLDKTVNWGSLCFFKNSFFIYGQKRVQNDQGFVQSNTPYLVTSSDGNSWNNTSINTGIGAVDWSYFGEPTTNGNILVGNAQYIVYSTDGRNWSRVTNLDTWNIHGNLLFGGGKFAYPATDQSLYSNDGINWYKGDYLGRAFGYSAFYGVGCYGKGVFLQPVMSDNNSNPVNDYITSANGINWTKRKFPTSLLWHFVDYCNGAFVAVGEKIIDSNAGKYAYYFYRSVDGVNWSQVYTYQWTNPDTLSSTSYRTFKANRATDEDKFIFHVQDKIFTSEDGLNWTVLNQNLLEFAEILCVEA